MRIVLDTNVLDTNVLVSSLINPNGKPAAVLNAILSRFVVPCYDEE